MVRSRVIAALVFLSVAGLCTPAFSQARGGARGGGSRGGGTAARQAPRPSPRPSPRPVSRPVFRGGNDAGGDSNVIPGSLARPFDLGIGTSSRANIDLLNNPAANRVFPSPGVVIDVGNGRRFDNIDRARWYYRHHHNDYYPYYPSYPTPYYYDPVSYVTAGTSLALGGYGYPYPVSYSAYPTVGVMELPAPAVAYDATTGTYVYGYGNPYGPPLVSANTYAAPSMPAVNPEVTYTPRQLTPMEQAVESIRLGMPDRAVSVLREHLTKNTDDARAERVMAVALLEQRRFDDAVASLRQAYRANPTLAEDPLNAYALGYNDDTLRSLVVRTVTYANRVNTGSAWLTVATLMQAEGRPEQARNALEKAAKQGLETEVMGAMMAALTRK